MSTQVKTWFACEPVILCVGGNNSLSPLNYPDLLSGQKEPGGYRGSELVSFVTVRPSKIQNM